jgi:hypothetical protein
MVYSALNNEISNREAYDDQSGAVSMINQYMESCMSHCSINNDYSMETNSLYVVLFAYRLLYGPSITMNKTDSTV